MQLQTQRLLIRYFLPSDLNQYAEIVADPAVMKFLDGPQSRQQAAAYLDEMIGLHKFCGLGRYAVELKQAHSLIGFCGFRPAGAYVTLGYRFATTTWGQGIGLEAALAVRQYGLESLKLNNMEAGAAVENQASIKILDKLDFKFKEELIFEGVQAIRYRDQESLQTAQQP